MHAFCIKGDGSSEKARARAAWPITGWGKEQTSVHPREPDSASAGRDGARALLGEDCRPAVCGVLQEPPEAHTHR